MDDAKASFRRATELDPKFAMAYYELANTLPPIDGRQAIARAAQLSESLPRLQQLLIQARQLSRDGRQDEAEQILKDAIREFPRETRPRVDLAIGIAFNELRWAEAIPIYEDALRLDDHQPFVYNALAYAYGFQGDLPRALAALGRYASLLPPNDPNPMDSRGDVLAVNQHFDEAIAEYKKNAQLNHSWAGTEAMKTALAYLFENKNALAEATAQSAFEKTQGIDRAFAASVEGDIAVGGGDLAKAVARYEQAAELLVKLDNPLLSDAPLRKAARIYLAQGEPQSVLGLARRHASVPEAAGLRAAAQIVLKNPAAAEKEFASLRASLTPLVGDHEAEKAIERRRLLGTAYAGQWAQVAAEGKHLYDPSRPVIALELGRASLETGNLAEAQNEFAFCRKISRLWNSSAAAISHDYLAAVLAGFYLAQIQERQGQRSEALNAYQEFLTHFENSNARLPEIAEARAALKRLM
jgi:tetratricopeptide (TPR) repeat protein